MLTFEDGKRTGAAFRRALAELEGEGTVIYPVTVDVFDVGCPERLIAQYIRKEPGIPFEFGPLDPLDDEAATADWPVLIRISDSVGNSAEWVAWPHELYRER